MTKNTTKNISKKASSAKLKARLALAGFAAVAVLAFTLTMVGVFSYATLNLNVQPVSDQANALIIPVSVAAQTAVLGSNLGK